MAFFPIIIAVDGTNQILVPSFNGSTGSWPAMFQGDTRDLQIQVVQPSGNSQTPYTTPSLSGYTCYVTIGATPKGDGSQIVYAQVSMVWDVPSNSFKGSLNLTSSAIATAIGTGSSTPATLDINISNGGVPQTLFQTSITIFAPENANGIVTPSPANQYLTAVQIANEFVPQGGGAAGQGFIMISPNGTKYLFTLNNDGTQNWLKLT